MSYEVAVCDSVESFGGVIESGVVDVVNRCSKLVTCDGGDDNVGVRCFAFGEVGSAGGFAGR